jgi:hypothetical protein
MRILRVERLYASSGKWEEILAPGSPRLKCPVLNQRPSIWQRMPASICLFSAVLRGNSPPTDIYPIPRSGDTVSRQRPDLIGVAMSMPTRPGQMPWHRAARYRDAFTQVKANIDYLN